IAAAVPERSDPGTPGHPDTNNRLTNDRWVDDVIQNQNSLAANRRGNPLESASQPRIWLQRISYLWPRRRAGPGLPQAIRMHPELEPLPEPSSIAKRRSSPCLRRRQTRLAGSQPESRAPRRLRPSREGAKFVAQPPD